MSLTQGLQIPFGIQTVNPIPVDSWSGPYIASNLEDAIDDANSSIPLEVRFQSMEVRIVVDGLSKKFWYRDGVTDNDLIEFISGEESRIFYISGGFTFSNNTSDSIYRTGSIGIGVGLTNSNRFVVSSAGGTVSLVVTDHGSVYNVDRNNILTNLAFGLSASLLNTTGFNNTAFGNGALYSNTNKSFNLAIGADSLFNNNADYNIGIGPSALFFNTVGTQNTSIGAFAMYYNVNGGFNTAIGVGSLQNGTASIRNTGIGGYSLYNTTGSRNIGIGFFGGSSITTGNDNTIIASDPNNNNEGITTGSKNTLIGKAVTGIKTGSNNTIIGRVSGLNIGLTGSVILADGNNNIRFYSDSVGNVGIGLTGPTNKLHIYSSTSGALRIQDGTEANGYVLTSDSNGVATWNIPSGGTQSLQETLNNGATATTSTGKLIDLTSNIELISNEANIGAVSEDNEVAIYLALGDFGDGIEPYINFIKTSTTGEEIRLRISNVTGERNVQFPDKDGTIAYLDDISGGTQSLQDTLINGKTASFIDAQGVLTEINLGEYIEDNFNSPISFIQERTFEDIQQISRIYQELGGVQLSTYFYNLLTNIGKVGFISSGNGDVSLFTQNQFPTFSKDQSFSFEDETVEPSENLQIFYKPNPKYVSGTYYLATLDDGVTEFIELTDVDAPSGYTGQGSKVVAVKADESGLEFVTGGGGIANVIQRVFSVTLAQLGAVDFNDDIPAKIKAYAIANSITKAVNETHDWEVTENFNFDFEYTGTDMFDNYGIEDEATFVSYLSGQGATNIAVTDFQLTPSRLRCNLTFDGITELDLSSFGINKINNLDSLVNLTYLYLGSNQIATIENLDSLVNLTALELSNNQITTIENLDLLVNLTYLDLSDNQITTIENLDSLVNLTTLYLHYNQITTIENLDALVNLTTLLLVDNQITTAQFNTLNSWAILAPINGSINTNNNTDNFNTSTTYTTLLGKGWSINL